MIEDVKEFFQSKSDLTYAELWKVIQESSKLEWLNITGELSNEEYLRQINSMNEKPLKNTFNFGKDYKKFFIALNHFYGEEKGKACFIHELKHAKICEKYNIDYFFGITIFDDVKDIGNGYFERTIQPFVQDSDKDLTLLNSRERILFHIENNEAPDDMSSGDEQAVIFWKEKLKEIDSKDISLS